MTAKDASLFNLEGVRNSLKAEIDGGVAQLAEHLLCKQGVDSSSLFISTRKLLSEREPRYGLIAQMVRARA